MAPVISVPANESIQNDHNYTKVDEIVLKVKNVNINRNGSAVTLAITTNNTQKKNQKQLHTDCEDRYSIEGKFGWKLIAGYHVPYIMRLINGEKLMFVSVRMAETQLLSRYLHYLHADMYTCTSIRSYFITDSEATLLNVINNFHCDFAFPNAIFIARKDYIVLLEDVQELYTFIEVCYKALLFNNNTDRKSKCGFILINFECVLPYSIKDGKQYIPLFCFEGESENLRHLTVKLENWNLAYLKFCCKVQGISNDAFFASDSCTVISLDDIKNLYSTETIFEEYWPPKIVDTQLLKNQNFTHVNPPGVWIKPPLEVVIAENSFIPHTLTEPAPVLPQSMPVMMNTHQNERPANQMAQLPSTTTTRDYSVSASTAQCYNVGSTMSQGSSLINGADHVYPPPPLFESVNTTPVIGDTVSYSNAVPLSVCMTTMNSQMTNSNVISHSNQMQQLYSQNAINNSQIQQQQIQQQQRQQQQIITNPQTQPSSNSQSVHGHLTNTQLHNGSRHVGPIVTVQETSLRCRVGSELTRIPKQIWANGTNNAAYKGSTMSQGSSLINGADHVYPPPPLFESVNTTPVIGDTVSYSNAVPLSVCMTTMNSQMTNSNVISHSNQMQQLYSQNAINNSQIQQQQIQQQQRQQQQIITNPQTQPSSNSQSVHGHLTNTQLHNGSRHVGPIVATPATKNIDLTSQPSNLMPPTVPDTSLRPRFGWELTRIPERTWANGTNMAPYKIEKVTLLGRMIHCINANPYIYSEVLITLQHLVQVVLPSWTVTNCAHILQKYSKITLFCGNSEQLALLWDSGLINSNYPEGTPMAMLRDIRHWLNTAGASPS